MKDLMVWILLMIVLFGLSFVEAGRRLYPDSIFDGSSRDELVYMAGYGEEKLSTVLITGTILCPEHEEALASPRPVSGVRVGVTCTTIKLKSEETWTDEFGEFTIDLPSQLHGIQNLDEVCQVKIIKVPKGKTSCNALLENKKLTMMMIKLVSANNGVRIYTTGKIHLKCSKPEIGVSVASAIVRLAKLPIEQWRG